MGTLFFIKSKAVEEKRWREKGAEKFNNPTYVKKGRVSVSAVVLCFHSSDHLFMSE
jgi:hypothetical protein